MVKDRACFNLWRATQMAGTLNGLGLLGTPEQIVEQIEAYVDLGIDYFMLGVKDVKDLTDLTDLTTVELLAREVFPYFKKP